MRAAFLITKAVVPGMISRGYGRIIYLGAVLSQRPQEGMIALGTSKAALSSFALYVAEELGPRGITVNVVLPSLTRTAMSEGLPEAVVNNSLGRQVIHRMAEPDDIAGSVLILAADEAGWITGQTIMANGGNSFGL